MNKIFVEEICRAVCGRAASDSDMLCPVFVCLSDSARFQFVPLIPSSPKYQTFDSCSDVLMRTGDNGNLNAHLYDLS